MQLEVLYRLNYRETLLEFYRCNDMEIEKNLAYKIFELLHIDSISFIDSKTKILIGDIFSTKNL